MNPDSNFNTSQVSYQVQQGWRIIDDKGGMIDNQGFIQWERMNYEIKNGPVSWNQPSSALKTLQCKAEDIVKRDLSKELQTPKEKMPGSFCCVFGCGSCSGRNLGLAFFSLKQAGEDTVWQRNLVRLCGRADKFDVSKAKICSRHFEEDCIKAGPRGRRQLLENRLPTKFLPIKSMPDRVVVPRKPPTLREPPDELLVSYNLKQLPCKWKMVIEEQGKLKACVFEDGHESASIMVTHETTECLIFGRKAEITIGQFVNLEDKLVKSVLLLDSQNLCPGIKDGVLQDLAPLADSDKTQSYYRLVNFTSHQGHIKHMSVVFASRCDVFSDELCPACKIAYQQLKKRAERMTSTKTLEVKAPVTKVQPQRLAATVMQQRNDIKELEKKISEKIDNEGVAVMHPLHDSLTTILSSAKIDNEFIRLFWEQQRHALNSNTRGMRWHPMLIRFAILLHSQSPAAYKTLRDSGALILPGQSTIREYVNAVHPQTGFNPEIIADLKKKVANYEENQRFIVLIFDEITIKSDLVFDRETGEVIGYVNSGSWLFNEATQERVVATHALFFMVIGISTNLKMTLGMFGTKTLKAEDMYPIFWKAVGILEMECNLKVVVATCDKASQNMKFLRLHGPNPCHKTTNIFAPDRFIFFISDPPHLMKTVRNNMFRHVLWNDGKSIDWAHIKRIYQDDQNRELSRTKLTKEHFDINPFSCMRVGLAVQVLSATVGRILEEYYGDEASETARFIQLMDRFFDCCNTRHLLEAQQKRKEDLMPYFSVDDQRFKFLLEEFVPYLNRWKASIQHFPGDLTAGERNKLFLSYQTYEGLIITTKSMVEATRYLLTNGVEFVLTNTFCQDPLELHFGRHRQLGHRGDNPTLYSLGYQENKLRLQRDMQILMTPRGNVENSRAAPKVSNSPLKKKPRL